METVKKAEHLVTREQRAKAIAGWSAKPVVPFRGCTVWLTGRPAAGKSTTATALEQHLISKGVAAYSLDPDSIKSGLNRNLGFTNADREENIRRIAELAKLLADSGQICITSMVSPRETDRAAARKIHDEAEVRFFEVFLDTSKEECEKRFPKDHLSSVRAGKLSFGADQYEPPKNPDLVVQTEEKTVKEVVQSVVEMLVKASMIPAALSETVPELFVNEADAK